MDQEWNNWVAKIYQKMYPTMYRTAYRLTGSRETADELVHDTFFLALSRREVLTVHPNPEGWLMVTLVNLVKNERKRLSSTDISLDAFPLNIPTPEGDQGIGEWLPAGLSPEDRQVLIWRFEDRLSHREIGDRLGISEVGSRSRLARALRKCKRLLENQDFHF